VKEHSANNTAATIHSGQNIPITEICNYKTCQVVLDYLIKARLGLSGFVRDYPIKARLCM